MSGLYHRGLGIPGFPGKGLLFFLSHGHPSRDIISIRGPNMQKNGDSFGNPHLHLSKNGFKGGLDLAQPSHGEGAVEAGGSQECQEIRLGGGETGFIEG